VLYAAEGVLEAAKAAKYIAEAPSYAADAVLQGVAGVLGGVREAWKGVLTFAQWVVRLGAFGALRIERIAFQLVTTQSFASEGNRVLDAAISGKIAGMPSFTISVKLDLTNVASILRTVFESVMSNVKSNLAALSLGVAHDPATGLPVVGEVLHSALAQCGADDVSCIEAYAHTRAVNARALNAALSAAPAAATTSLAQADPAAVAQLDLVERHLRDVLLNGAPQMPPAALAAHAAEAAKVDGAVDRLSAAVDAAVGAAKSAAAEMANAALEDVDAIVRRVPEGLRANATAALRASAPAIRTAVREVLAAVESGTPAGSARRQEALDCVATLVSTGLSDGAVFKYALRRCQTVVDKGLVKARSNASLDAQMAANDDREALVKLAAEIDRNDLKAALAALRAKFGARMDAPKQSRLHPRGVGGDARDD
jgi:hypothetical protein